MDREERARRSLDRYLVPGESVVLAVRLHPAKAAEPVATAAVAFVVVAWLETVVTRAVGPAGSWVWWLWFAVLARSVWLLVDWSHEWFVVTERRLLLVHGLVTRRVSMMPLLKVTDMNYSRSPLGRALGYGEFTLESAGQEQALHRIRWVPHPDETYRTIVGTIFPPDRLVLDEDQRRPSGRRSVATAPSRGPRVERRPVRPAASGATDARPGPPGATRDDDTEPIAVTREVVERPSVTGPDGAGGVERPDETHGDWSRAVRVEPFRTRDPRR
ncbi:PH domain-containing protein [Cellulomonas massiliensis]|uniref:PH domain-containing protein n=1 Tax=Cellulomonas massiliensis TaxID=1465811 RepID=UPI0002EF4C3F|nr:PH domain-containing protein [Cellulomonas massiliensis]